MTKKVSVKKYENIKMRKFVSKKEKEPKISIPRLEESRPSAAQEKRGMG